MNFSYRNSINILMQNIQFRIGIILFCIILSTNGYIAHAQKNDPAQRIPDGVTIPDYYRRTVKPEEKVEPRIDPPFWWCNMPDKSLTLLIHDKNIGLSDISISNSAIKLTRKHFLENKNYLSFDLDLSKIKKGITFEITLTKGKQIKKYPYTLKERIKKSNLEPLNSSDLIYLIMPDRFANGEPANDVIPGMNQQGVDRSKMYFRHGGDLRGIQNNLEYFEKNNFSCLWLNPIQENNQFAESYHGYAITDHFRIDPRFGNNEDYANLAKSAHEKKIKVIMDLVFNHCGTEHYFIKDLPNDNWLHQWDTFTRTNYQALPLVDPHASSVDKKLTLEGWFDKSMPDLNQDQIVLGKYLIQYSIWWCEYADLDGLRVDTWFYSDKTFMEKWLHAIQHYDPSIKIFQETWVNAPGVLAYFNSEEYLGKQKSPIQIKDFPLAFAIHEALTKPYSWDGGVAKLHATLAQDFNYYHPEHNLIFLDNHDLSRIYSILGEDLDKWKQAIALLFCLRGIPAIYYGTEILMKNYANPDGLVREDFPGGWKEDSINYFISSNLKNKNKEAFDYFNVLSSYRANHKDFYKNAQFTQFLCKDNLYISYLKHRNKILLCMINTDSVIRKKELVDIFSDKITNCFDIFNKVDMGNEIEVPPHGVRVIEINLNVN